MLKTTTNSSTCLLVYSSTKIIMNSAIKRVQSQTRLSYAEREQNRGAKQLNYELFI